MKTARSDFILEIPKTTVDDFILEKPEVIAPGWKECPICFKQFPKFGKRKYCSPSCSTKANIGKVGIWREHHQSPERTKISNLRKQPCLRCGSSGYIILHDVIPRCDGGEWCSDNLIPLGQDCHCHRNLHRKPYRKGGWRIWEIEDKLKNNPLYEVQYWLVQILKNENYTYWTGSVTMRDITEEYLRYNKP